EQQDDRNPPSSQAVKETFRRRGCQEGIPAAPEEGAQHEGERNHRGDEDEATRPLEGGEILPVVPPDREEEVGGQVEEDQGEKAAMERIEENAPPAEVRLRDAVLPAQHGGEAQDEEQRGRSHEPSAESVGGAPGTRVAREGPAEESDQRGDGQ